MIKQSPALGNEPTQCRMIPSSRSEPEKGGHLGGRSGAPDPGFVPEGSTSGTYIGFKSGAG